MKLYDGKTIIIILILLLGYLFLYQPELWDQGEQKINSIISRTTTTEETIDFAEFPYNTTFYECTIDEECLNNYNNTICNNDTGKCEIS